MAFVRYTLVGTVATGAHYAVLVTLVEVLRLPPAHASALGALCGATVAYLANRRFTFSSTARHRQVLPRFLLIAALGAALNGLMVWVGTSVLGWHYVVAQGVVTAAVLILTYSLNREWTFA